MADEEWIERLARSLCSEAGLDPDAATFAAGAVADAAEPTPDDTPEQSIVLT